MSGYKGLREIVWETIKENIIVLFLAVGLWFLYLCGIFSECFVLYLIKIEDIIPVTVAASISLLGLLVAAVTFQAKSNKEEIEKAADYVQKMTQICK
ncbi:MAG: hypothetical protein MUD10_02330 [Candidatus Pacebacteria bacterium]|nr:hypothetical protein [Candidatus Paceibacterota bacterium]